MRPVALFFILASTAAAGLAADMTIGRFSSSDLTGWNEKLFRGETDYTLVMDGEKKVLQAHSRQAASGLIREVNLDPKRYPLLRWSWKVERSLKREDIRKKSGEDFAARVYVVFPRRFFWRMRAINYVWADKMPRGSHATSPYTSNAVIIAVESGDEKKGQWVSEERNISDDYKKVFGEEPPPVGAIAIMTDTDDTKDEVTAWYGDISVRGPRSP